MNNRFAVMNVLIQQNKTSLYWRRDDSWTPHLDEACDFGELFRALHFIRENAIEDSKVILQSPTAIYDIFLDLKNGDTTVFRRKHV